MWMMLWCWYSDCVCPNLDRVNWLLNPSDGKSMP